MKMHINLRLSLVFLSSIIIFSCQKQPEGLEIGQMEFNFSISDLKSAHTDTIAASTLTSIIVSIEDLNGKIIKNSEKVEFYKMNGSYISKPLSLPKGSYKLTRFLVLDWQNNVVYASPLKGSAKAYLVTNPLPLTYSVQTNLVTKVATEVLNAAGSKPEDFGYSTFSFNVAQTFDFLVGTFIYDDTIKNFKLTSSTVSIYTDTILYSGQITVNPSSVLVNIYDSLGVTNKITLPERYNKYSVVISKPGYNSFSKTFTKEELKLHLRSVDKGPLVVILDKMNQALPILTTTLLANITQISVLCGGNITAEGSSLVSARGICWSTSTNPTIADSKTMDGTGKGIYSSSLTGLKAFTTYYVRAYATNGNGTAYGNLVSFMTSGWVQKSSMPDAGRYAAISFTINGKAYVGTGTKSNGTYLSDLWEYDPSVDKWTKKADFPGGVRSGATAFSIKNKGYVGLGSGDNISANFKSDLWEYDPLNNVWSQKADFPGILRANGKSFVIGDTAFVGTGTYNNGMDYLYDFYMYVPVTNSWTQRSDFGGSNRNGAVAFSIENRGYMGAGAESNKIRRNDVWTYNKKTNFWSRIADFPGGTRVSSCSFTIGNKSYVGTGEDGTSHYSSFYEYNPNNDTWSPVITNAASPRTNAVGFSIGNIGYFATGNYSTICLADLWAFIPGYVIAQ